MSLFQRGQLHGNVVLNFRDMPRAEFGAFASAFWRAARSLAEQLASSQGYKDTDACPIVFLYRHAIELYMKALVFRGRNVAPVAGEDVSLNRLGNHQLTPLLPSIRRIFQEMGWSWDTDAAQVERIANELDRFNPYSFTFRYPTDKRGRSRLPEHFTFNVLELAEQAENALELLANALTGLEEDDVAPCPSREGARIVTRASSERFQRAPLCQHE